MERRLMQSRFAVEQARELRRRAAEVRLIAFEVCAKARELQRRAQAMICSFRRPAATREELRQKPTNKKRVAKSAGVRNPPTLLNSERALSSGKPEFTDNTNHSNEGVVRGS